MSIENLIKYKMNEDEFIEGLDDEDDMEEHMLDLSSKPRVPKVEANWSNVLQFIRDKHRQIEIKQTEWMIEKQQLKLKVSTLTAQNKAYHNSVNDCMRRIKMLEFALRQERIRYARAANGVEDKFNILQDHPDVVDVDKLADRPPYQRHKGHQSILIKFLEEVGFEDVFNSSDIAEIKDLFNKAASSLNSNQQLLDSVAKIEAGVRAKVESDDK